MIGDDRRGRKRCSGGLISITRQTSINRSIRVLPKVLFNCLGVAFSSLSSSIHFFTDRRIRSFWSAGCILVQKRGKKGRRRVYSAFSFKENIECNEQGKRRRDEERDSLRCVSFEKLWSWSHSIDWLRILSLWICLWTACSMHKQKKRGRNLDRILSGICDPPGWGGKNS